MQSEQGPVTPTIVPQDKWVRSKDGIVAGICEGIGRAFAVEPWLVRVIFLVSTFIFGTSILLYIVGIFTLPREDRVQEAHQKKFLGVCYRISRESNVDVGLVRLLTVLLALFSGVIPVLFFYVVLHFLVPGSYKKGSII